jgi:sporulation protein YlmC with PRC-barrel domain
MTNRRKGDGDMHVVSWADIMRNSAAPIAYHGIGRRAEDAALGLTVAKKTENKKMELSALILNKAKAMEGYTLRCLDGEVGIVKEFYFDDLHWTVRYLVAETNDWLTDRQVLISPHALESINKEERNIVVNLTQKQIEGSPSLDANMPLSRAFEEDYYGYYGWPSYWDGPFMWGSYSFIPRSHKKQIKHSMNGKAWDTHLSNTSALSGYNIQASDGEIGRVEDFVIDHESWAIRYLIVDAQDWRPGEKVLISPRWIERVNYRESKVFIYLLRDAVKLAPEYANDSLPTREYEIGLHRHYDRQGYWEDESVASEEFVLHIPRG